MNCPHLTDELAHRIAQACIHERQARTVLADSERNGATKQARVDRTTHANAERALTALIREAEAGA